MGSWPKTLALAVIMSTMTIPTLGAPVVVFPNARDLRSPDGRFVLCNAERDASATELVGTFHSLWLIEVGTDRSRKLCDYVGVAAAGWSDNDHLVVTEYLGKKSSRALMFSATSPGDSVVIDKGALISLMPAESRAILRESDHVFVEAIGVQREILRLTVWGNGQHEKNGFRWHCGYDLREHTIACTE